VDQLFEPASPADAPSLARDESATAPVSPTGPGAAPAGGDDLEPMLRRIDRIIAGLDRLITEQVNAVIHHQRFRRLEASWRSVARLVETAGRSPGRIKVRLLDLRWPELCRDLERAIEFDQSYLFRKIYEEEFGMAGGQPFGLLVGDYIVAHRRGPQRTTDDIAALQGMARIAAAAFAPFVVGASPELFGLDDFAELSLPIDLAATFRSPEYARWHSFQEHDDSRFVGLVLPGVISRGNYRDDDTRGEGFRYREQWLTSDDVAWGSGAFAFAAVVMRAFSESGWFAAIRGGVIGVEEGGLVPDLEIPWFDTDAAGVATIFPGEAQVEDGQEAELGELGFIPMVRANGTSLGVFCGNASAQRPRVYDRLAATVNARLSSMLQYILCVSRFAHYLKVLGREKIGSFASAEELQRDLQSWVMEYTNTNELAPLATLARYPLREARIEVRQVAGSAGAYYCVAHLQPHFQLERVETTFRLMTQLGAAA
jgi:type VI secretion system protein ImpD